jgi:hypothetical protein
MTIEEEGNMTAAQGTGALMRIGLILAVVIIVIRIGLEQMGSPEAINNIFGVAWLYLILPVLFAWRIAAVYDAHRFKALFKDVLLFALCTRLMVLVTYMLAYLFQWDAPRFSSKMGGNVGGDTTPFVGLVLIPVRNAVFWILMATVVGMIIGGITLWLRKTSSSPSKLT